MDFQSFKHLRKEKKWPFAIIFFFWAKAKLEYLNFFFNFENPDH